MIIFETISFKNFLSTGNQFTTIQLNKSITTIMTGSNGGGKSTFEDALVYNLFGKPFRKVKLGQLINNVNERDLVTESVFSIGNKKYKVIRGQKPALFEIWVDDIIIPQPAETKDYQHILENDILKLNYKTFTQIIILGSASFVPFMQLPLGTRREIIENILDISVFSDMNDILKDKIKETEGEIEDTKHKIDIANTNYKLKFEFFETINRDNEKRVVDYEEKIGEMKKSILLSTMKKEAFEKDIIEISKLIKEFGDIESKKNAAGLKMMELEKDINSKTYQIKSFNDTNTRYIELQGSINDAEKDVKITAKDISSIGDVIKKLDEYLLRFKGIDEIKVTAEEVISRSKQIIKDRNEKIKFFKENNDCPSCGKYIDCDGTFESNALDNFSLEIGNAGNDIIVNQKIIADVILQQTERDELKNDRIKHEKQVTALNQKMQMYGKLLTSMISTKKELKFTKPEEVQDIHDAIDKLKFDLTLLVSEIHDYKQKIVELNDCKDKLSKSKNGISLCDQMISGNEKLINQHLFDIEKIKNEPPSDVTQEVLDELIVGIKELDLSLNKSKGLLYYYGIVKRLLKDDGIKTTIISQYLPTINATVNMYLDKMDFPINFMFDENFNELIKSNYRDEFSYHSFSEGEKARIDLALLFTWRDIALKKSRNATNILIFDEIFDGSLDASGIENFMEILGVNKEGFSTFVISHKDETINARFDRNLVFVKEGHFSTMEEK